MGVGSQVIPSVAGTSHEFVPSSAPKSTGPRPHRLRTRTCLYAYHNVISQQQRKQRCSWAAPLPAVCVFTQVSTCVSTCVQTQTRTHCPGHASGSTDTQGARCCDAGWLQLSPFSAQVGHKQHFTASGRVIWRGLIRYLLAHSLLSLVPR